MFDLLATFIQNLCKKSVLLLNMQVLWLIQQFVFPVRLCNFSTQYRKTQAKSLFFPCKKIDFKGKDCSPCPINFSNQNFSAENSYNNSSISSTSKHFPEYVCWQKKCGAVHIIRTDIATKFVTLLVTFCKSKKHLLLCIKLCFLNIFLNFFLLFLSKKSTFYS